MNKKAAEVMRQTAGKLLAWADAIAELNREIGILVSHPMAREAKRLLDEAQEIDPIDDVIQKTNAA